MTAQQWISLVSKRVRGLSECVSRTSKKSFDRDETNENYTNGTGSKHVYHTRREAMP